MLNAFKRVHPTLIQVPWTMYGRRLKLQDGRGVRKYQGWMLAALSGNKQFELHPHGYLPDPAGTQEIVRNKLGVLVKHPDAHASVEYRNPPTIYGGGLRGSNPDDLVSLSGLPEPVDHLLLAHCMHLAGLLNKPDWKIVIDRRWQPLVPVLDATGMSGDDYGALNLFLYDMLLQEWR